MKKISETITFFGSGPVAAKSLELLAQDFSIEAVITKPRPPHHKGSVPVLEMAEKLGVRVLTAENKKSLDDLLAGKPVSSEVGVLIDFGIIVSQTVIDYFPRGIINSHFSLLPEWRGADPITFSILSGQKQTGVSLMLLTAGMDEGPLLACGIYELDEAETTPILTENLIQLSDALLKKELPLYLDGDAKTVSQAEMSEQIPNYPSKPSYSRKLSKDDSNLDWSKPAGQLEREIRAFLEWPKSRTQFGDLDVVITKAHVIDQNGEPGTTAIVDKLPLVFCAKDALVIDAIKPAGKPEMNAQAFLAGYKERFLAA